MSELTLYPAPHPIRWRRVLSGLNKEDTARLAGVDRAAVSRLEDGSYRGLVGLATIARIEAALDTAIRRKAQG